MAKSKPECSCGGKCGPACKHKKNESAPVPNTSTSDNGASKDHASSQQVGIDVNLPAHHVLAKILGRDLSKIDL